MGDSLPPPAAIDLVDSFARRRGDEVELVVAEPALSADPVEFSLRKGRSTVVGRVDSVVGAEGRRLICTAPSRGLRDGIWQIRVRSAAGGDEPVGARLLVQGQRPLVLLWGAKTTPSLVPSPRADRGRKTLIAERGGRLLDRGLAVLPPARAQALRSKARTVARKVLS